MVCHDLLWWQRLIHTFGKSLGFRESQIDEGNVSYVFLVNFNTSPALLLGGHINVYIILGGHSIQSLRAPARLFSHEAWGNKKNVPSAFPNETLLWELLTSVKNKVN
jgi:hypothetical protein